MQDKFNVLIIGGGPGGLSIGSLLAREGLFRRRSEIGDTGEGEGAVHGSEAFASASVWPREVEVYVTCNMARSSMMKEIR